MDFIVEYACPTSGTPECATPGDPAPIAPPPLLPDFGVAGAYSYNMDMVVSSASPQYNIENAYAHIRCLATSMRRSGRLVLGGLC